MRDAACRRLPAACLRNEHSQLAGCLPTQRAFTAPWTTAPRVVNDPFFTYPTLPTLFLFFFFLQVDLTPLPKWRWEAPCSKDWDRHIRGEHVTYDYITSHTMKYHRTIVFYIRENYDYVIYSNRE